MLCPHLLPGRCRRHPAASGSAPRRHAHRPAARCARYPQPRCSSAATAASAVPLGRRSRCPALSYCALCCNACLCLAVAPPFSRCFQQRQLCWPDRLPPAACTCRLDAAGRDIQNKLKAAEAGAIPLLVALTAGFAPGGGGGPAASSVGATGSFAPVDDATRQAAASALRCHARPLLQATLLLLPAGGCLQAAAAGSICPCQP